MKVKSRGGNVSHTRGRRRAGILIALTAAIAAACAPPPEGDGKTVILSYNVQNLFDAEFDGSEYEEFIPGRSWGPELYHLRLHGLSEVIRNSSPPPDIVLLQEVEDADVLEDLCSTYLPEYGYTHRIVGGPEESATQVALLTHLPVVAVRTHAPPVGDHPVRNILEARVRLGGGDLILFGNHWKSRSGGGEEGDRGGELRRRTARMLRLRLEGVLREEPTARILLAGDFNCEPSSGDGGGSRPLALGESAETIPVTESLPVEGGVEGVDGFPRFFSPWALAEEGGSYRYQGRWERIDAFYLSPALLSAPGPRFEEFRLHRWEALRNREGEPLRWIREFETGFSDHLPILLILDNDGA